MSSPVFAHGQMRLYLLTLLEHEPMHGYELMQAIEQRFSGTYVPSAGTIYPRLAKLADEGLITKQMIGRKTVYAITDAGRAELDARKDETDQLEEDIDTSARQLADELREEITHSMGSLKDDLNIAADNAARFRASYRHNPASAFGSASATSSAKASRSSRDRDLLNEAETMIYRFGLTIRDTLRAADSVGALRSDTLRRVEQELDHTVANIRALVNHHD